MPDKSNVVKLPRRAPEPDSAPPPAAVRAKPGVIDQALAYWNRIRAGRPMPARADLSPGDIPKLLPCVILMDVLHEPLDFRYRLIGTEIDRICHRNYKGAKMSELPDKRSPNPIWQHHQEAVETRAPVRRALSYVGPDGDVMRVEHCVLPFSDSGKTVDHLLVAVDVERRL